MKKISVILLFAILLTFAACAGTENDVSDEARYNMNNLAANQYAYCAQVNGKLYVIACSSDGTEYVLTEISETGSKEIYREDIASETPEDAANFDYEPFNLNNMIDNRVYTRADSASYIDLDSGKLHESDESLAPDDHRWSGYIIGGVRYFTDGSDRFIRFSGEKYEDIIKTDPEEISPHCFYYGAFCVYGSDLYYEKYAEDSTYICRFDMDSRKELATCKIAENKDMAYDGVSNMIAQGKDVYYTIDGGLYHADLAARKNELIYGFDHAVSFNYLNGTFYVWEIISEDCNLYELKIGGEPQKIADGVFGVYIFDDKYVYYDRYEGDSEVFSRMDTSDRSVKEVLRTEAGIPDDYDDDGIGIDYEPNGKYITGSEAENNK